MPKAVVHIISRLNIGGPSKVILYFHQRLIEENIPSLIICGHAPTEEGELEIPRHLRKDIIYLKGLSPNSGLWGAFIAGLKLMKVLRKIKPTVIHSHQAKAGALGRICGKLSGVPGRFHTYHGHVFQGYFSPWKTTIIRLMEKTFALFATKNFAISAQIYQEITQKYKVSSTQKTQLIPVGIEPDLLQQSLDSSVFKKHFGLLANKKIIGFVGRLAAIKNPFAYLELAHQYCQKYKDSYFIIVGDGPLKIEVLQKISELGLDQNLVLLPWVTKVEEILVCLDLLVLTSKNEGTPLTIMEAMALQIPVLTTKVGGIVDLIEDGKTGYYFSSVDHISAEELHQVLQEPKESKQILLANAKEKIQSQYTLEHSYQLTKEVYRGYFS